MSAKHSSLTAKNGFCLRSILALTVTVTGMLFALILLVTRTLSLVDGDSLGGLEAVVQTIAQHLLFIAIAAGLVIILARRCAEIGRHARMPLSSH